MGLYTANHPNPPLCRSGTQSRNYSYPHRQDPRRPASDANGRKGPS